MTARLLDNLFNRDIGEIVFFASYAAILAFSLMGQVPILGGYLKVLENVFLALLAAGFVVSLRVYTAQELLGLVFMLATSLVIARSSNDYSLIKLALLIGSMKGICLRRCIHFDAALRVVVISLLIALSLSGVVEDAIFYSAAGAVRHSLGFTHPNQLGMACTILCLEILYLHGMKLKAVPCVIVVAIVASVDYFSASRTSELIVMLALCLCVANTWFPKLFKGEAFLKCVQVAPFVCAGATLLSVVLYQQGFQPVIALDEVLSYRIQYITYHIQLTDIGFFGSDISANGKTLDSCYAYLLLCQGVVATAAYSVAIPVLMKRLKGRGDYALMIVFLCLFVYGLSERLWLSVDYDALMLAFSVLVYGDGGLNDAAAGCRRADANRWTARLAS